MMKNETKKCFGTAMRRQNDSNVTYCKEMCKEIPNCNYFSINSRKVCKFYELCDKNRIELADHLTTIYKNIKGKRNHISFYCDNSFLFLMNGLLFKTLSLYL